MTPFIVFSNYEASAKTKEIFERQFDILFDFLNEACVSKKK